MLLLFIHSYLIFSFPFFWFVWLVSLLLTMQIISHRPGVVVHQRMENRGLVNQEGAGGRILAGPVFLLVMFTEDALESGPSAVQEVSGLPRETRQALTTVGGPAPVLASLLQGQFITRATWYQVINSCRWCWHTCSHAALGSCTAVPQQWWQRRCPEQQQRQPDGEWRVETWEIRGHGGSLSSQDLYASHEGATRASWALDHVFILTSTLHKHHEKTDAQDIRIHKGKRFVLWYFCLPKLLSAEVHWREWLLSSDLRSVQIHNESHCASISSFEILVPSFAAGFLRPWAQGARCWLMVISIRSWPARDASKSSRDHQFNLRNMETQRQAQGVLRALPGCEHGPAR